jgi:dTDP-4-amino-4,6-dideoxygalactose transaminase
VSGLAVLGAAPAFAEGVPFVRPAVPPFERVAARVAPSYDRGMLTNGPLVAELEAATAERLGVAHVVAVASCTAGLMLAVRVLAPDGTVVMPSFTFSASAHAVAWNGLVPVFAECDPASFQLDLDDAKGRLDGAGLVLATHVFGAPCGPEAVEELAASAGAPVLFDAAHAFGSRHGGRPIGGFGDVEVFSLTPTKPLVAGEGGLVATNRADIAYGVRIGRDYANPGDYDTRFVGLNARMSELHAAIALESLRDFDEHLARRREIASRYTDGLRSIAGVRVQEVDASDESTYKDFTIAVDGTSFGVTRDELAAALQAEGVGTRNYFDPPVHRQQAYAGNNARLPVTDVVATTVVSLPIYPGLPDATVDRIIEVVAAVQAHASDVRHALRLRRSP